MPPPSFLLERGRGLSSPCCPAAPGSTAETSALCPSRQCAICIQPSPAPVTHPCWRTSCLQRVKKCPQNPARTGKATGSKRPVTWQTLPLFHLRGTRQHPDLPSLPPARDAPSWDLLLGTAEKLGQAGACQPPGKQWCRMQPKHQLLSTQSQSREQLPRGADEHVARACTGRGPRLKEKLWVVYQGPSEHEFGTTCPVLPLASALTAMGSTATIAVKQKGAGHTGWLHPHPAATSERHQPHERVFRRQLVTGVSPLLGYSQVHPATELDRQPEVRFAKCQQFRVGVWLLPGGSTGGMLRDTPPALLLHQGSCPSIYYAAAPGGGTDGGCEHEGLVPIAGGCCSPWGLTSIPPASQPEHHHTLTATSLPSPVRELQSGSCQARPNREAKQ